MHSRAAVIFHTILVILALLAWCVPVALAEGETLGDVVDRQLQVLDTEQMQRFINNLDDEVRRQLPEFSLRDIVMDPEHGLHFNLREFLVKLGRYLIREILFNSALLGQLIVLAILCALLQTLSTAFEGKAVGEVAFMLSFLVLIFIGVKSFRSAMDIGQETIDTMVSMMHALLPMLATMLAAVGAITSATLFHPLLITSVNLIAALVADVIFPLVFFSAILGIIGNFATGFPLSKLSGLMKQAVITLFGLAFTLFAGVMVVRGAIAPVADGAALRTAKFLTGSFVPVVGKMLADSLDVVVGGSMLIKNAIGVFGLVTIFVMTAFPIIKIASIVIIYKLATAVVQPLVDNRLVDALGSMAQGLTLLLAGVLTTSLMFFIGITVLIGVGNLTAIMR